MGDLKATKANNEIQRLPLWGRSSTGLVPRALFNFREKDENYKSDSGCDLDLVSALPQAREEPCNLSVF